MNHEHSNCYKFNQLLGSFRIMKIHESWTFSRAWLRFGIPNIRYHNSTSSLVTQAVMAVFRAVKVQLVDIGKPWWPFEKFEATAEAKRGFEFHASKKASHLKCVRRHSVAAACGTFKWPFCIKNRQEFCAVARMIFRFYAPKTSSIIKYHALYILPSLLCFPGGVIDWTLKHNSSRGERFYSRDYSKPFWLCAPYISTLCSR